MKKKKKAKGKKMKAKTAARKKPAKKASKKASRKRAPVRARTRSRQEVQTPQTEEGGPLPLGMQQTQVVSKSRVPRQEESNTFAPGSEEPERTPVPGIRNPQGAQGGRGPLNQEGEGNRQNDEEAELEQVEPELK